jgi:pseudouridine-5'-phosphate glycosidase
MQRYVVYGDDVARAHARRMPLVALETTILSHGMPYPQNVQTAMEVEAIVKQAGCIPATIAVLKGRIHVGLSPSELEHLGRSNSVLKLSRADLPYALSSGKDGATTVSATMVCAHVAGLAIFATGGIGGVHRGAQETLDVSADLYELARTPVTVVCAGAKALLDLRKTLELLETLGVPVAGYQTPEFPAFWSRNSGLPVPIRFERPGEIVEFLHVKRDIGMESGTLVVNPIPAEDEIPAAEMEPFIARAVEEAQQKRIAGKALTPWLLDRIYALTEGRSLAANIALVKNNARLAAQIARELYT